MLFVSSNLPSSSDHIIASQITGNYLEKIDRNAVGNLNNFKARRR